MTYFHFFSAVKAVQFCQKPSPRGSSSPSPLNRSITLAERAPLLRRTCQFSGTGEEGETRHGMGTCFVPLTEKCWC